MSVMNKQEADYCQMIAETLERKHPFHAMEDGKAVMGVWHKVMMPELQCANGEEYCCYLKKGSSENVIIFMVGGGLLWDKKSAVLPATIHTSFTETPGFYTSEMVPMNDFWFFGARDNNGILSLSDENPFRDWSIGMVNYGTADFHLGQNEFCDVHCQGLKNLHACLKLFQKHFPSPCRLLICGESAGGFSVPGVAEEVLKYFPCKEVTLLTDASLLERKDWRHVARDVWKVPGYLWQCLHSDDILTDWYKRFLAVHPTARCLYSGGIHDVALAQFQCVMDGGPFEVTASYLDALPVRLKAQHDRLVSASPDFGFYYHDFPDQSGLGSQHMTLAHPTFTEAQTEGVSPAQWLWDAVNGKVKSYGVRSLE